MPAMFRCSRGLLKITISYSAYVSGEGIVNIMKRMSHVDYESYFFETTKKSLNIEKTKKYILRTPLMQITCYISQRLKNRFHSYILRLISSVVRQFSLLLRKFFSCSACHRVEDEQF